MVKILLIDDDPHLQMTLKIGLTRSGYDVLVAGDGEQGLKLLRDNRIDILITDIMMPGKEGIETIIDVRKLYPDIKILAISGGGQSGNITFLNMAKKFGAAGTLAKPFTVKALSDCVMKIAADL